MRYPCPCCGHLVFADPPGGHDICGICFWEDDLVQLRLPASTGANRVTLPRAQANYRDFGACDEHGRRFVRPARPDDPRDPGWRPIDPAVDRFESRATGPWPDDRTTLYWWRPTFWRRHAVSRLKVCLNGTRTAAEHPAVPVSPSETEAAARAAVRAGAEAVHLHPRDATGAESLDAGHVSAGVAAARRAGVPVGVSTGLWITGGDVARRHDLVRGWADLPATAKPDFASVNLGEPGFAALAETLRAAGIGVEAGVWTLADADALSDHRHGLTRVLVEIMGGDDPVGQAEAILGRLDGLGISGQRLLHGEGAACWPLIAHAGRLGIPTRAGLEDTLTGPDGEPVTDNADLVRLALRVITRWPRRGGATG